MYMTLFSGLLTSLVLRWIPNGAGTFVTPHVRVLKAIPNVLNRVLTSFALYIRFYAIMLFPCAENFLTE